jgi:hypothetical protein
VKARHLTEGDPVGSRRRYEFAVAVLLVALVGYGLLQALESAQQAVDEANMQAEVAALRVELLDVLAHREAYGGELPQSANPLRWVAREPAGYVGEFDSADAAPRTRGVWFFDRSRGELVYRLHSGRDARFRLERGAGAAQASGTLAGVGLARVDDAGGQRRRN